MQKLRDKYEAIGQAAIDKVKLTDNVVFEVSLGIVPNFEQQGAPEPGTYVIVSLAHNKLLGQPSIVAPYPIPSMNIAPDLIEKLALRLLEDCRQERDRQNSEPVQAQAIPAGLRGKRL